MRLHQFTSEISTINAFSVDEAGRNLPPAHTWRHLASFDVPPSAIGGDTALSGIIDQVASQGFVVWNLD